VILNVLTVFAVVVTFAGWGFLIPRAPSGLRFADRAILGVVVIGAAGMLINVFAPLGGYVAIATVCVGAAAFAARLRAVWSSLGERPRASALAMLALVVVFGVGSGLTGLHGDTALYHLQSLGWMEQSKVVFGIANIHDRLGFNSIWRIVAGMLDVPGMGRRGIFLPNFAMYVIVFGGFLQLAFRSTWSQVRHPVTNLFATCVMVLFMGSAIQIPFDYISIGPSYDSPTWLLTLYALWRYLEIRESQSGDDADRLMVIAATALAIMVKVSTVPLVLLIPVVLRGHVRLLRHPLTLTVTITGMLWLATGLVSSGCLVFPAASTCIEALPWSIPKALAQFQADSITAWARNPTINFMTSLHNWDWLAAWPKTMLANRPFVPTTCITLGVLTAALAGCAIFDLVAPRAQRLERPTSMHAPLAGAFVIALAGAGFWFLKAPDPRFGLGFLFAVAAVLLVWGAAGGARIGSARFLATGTAQLALFSALSLWVLIAHPGKLHLSYPPQWNLPQPQLEKRMMGEVEVWVPTPAGQVFCWDAPLPCSPIPNDKLRQGHYGPWRHYSTARTP
jgi:hypothetical protein